MTRSLILIEQGLDELWRQHITALAEQAHIIDLDNPETLTQLPHRNNIYRWYRWLRGRGIDEMHCWGMGAKSRLIIAAAVMNHIPVKIHLTGKADSRLAIRLLGRYVESFHCPGRFIARQLREMRIAEQEIVVDIPRVEAEKISEERLVKIRREIVTHQGDGPETAPMLLALPRPGNRRGLKNVIWASALLRHVFGNLTLVVAGECWDKERSWLDNWQKRLDSQGMVFIDNDSHNWDELAALCDVVVGSDDGNDIIRLLHAQAADRPIVACAYREFIQPNTNSYLATNPQPRQLAQAVMPLIDKTLS